MTCGVPQESILGPLNFCMYMYPLDSILRHHGKNYHIYANNSQLYIFFDLSGLRIAINKVSKCISNLRTWMIQNKLENNDSKTEFIIFTSSFLKQHVNDLNISVGNSGIAPSISARNLGVIFNNLMSLDGS